MLPQLSLFLLPFMDFPDDFTLGARDAYGNHKRLLYVRKNTDGGIAKRAKVKGSLPDTGE